MVQRTSEKASALDVASRLASTWIIPVGEPGVASYKVPLSQLRTDIDVRLYGETGTNDDTATLMAALAAAGSKGRVYVPSGVTLTVENVSLSSRSIAGEGTIKWKANASQPMLTATGDDCRISGVKLDGNSANQSGSIVGVTLTTATRFRMESCDITGFRYRFLLTDEGGELSPDGSVVNCRFYDCGSITNCDVLGIRSSRWFVGGTSFRNIGDGHCVRLGLYTDSIGLGPVRDTRIVGCHFQDTQHVGVTCELHTVGAVIDACIFRNLEQAVKTEIQSKSVTDITVSNCLIHTLTGTDAVNLSAPRVTFVNNRCYDWAGSLTLNSYAKVHGNYFSNCGSLANTQPTIQAITAGGYAAEGDFSIQHNDIYGAPYRGISVTVGKLKAIGNTITTCADRAINTGGSDNDISGNKIDGCTIGIVMSSTFSASRVRGNELLNCSTSQVSFTSNASFRSVVMKDNGLTSDDYNEVIATGAITVGASEHSVILDTEGGAATDDLDTITPTTGIVPGHVLVIRSNANARDPVIKHNTGNIILVGGVDFTLATTASKIALMWSNTKWQELWRNTA